MVENKAKELFDAGYRQKQEGLIESMISNGDKIGEVQEYYNNNCLGVGEDLISRNEAKKIFREYDRNSKKWLNDAGEQINSKPTGILEFIIAIIGFIIWKSIKYFKVLIETCKMANLVDKIDNPRNKEEDNVKCNKCKALLSNPKICPSNLMSVANTTKWMSVGGILMILSIFINPIFNMIMFASSFDFSTMLTVENIFILYSGLGFVARHKKGGALFYIGSIVYSMVYYVMNVLWYRMDVSFTNDTTIQVLYFGDMIWDMVFMLILIGVFSYIITNKKMKKLETGFIICLVANIVINTLIICAWRYFGVEADYIYIYDVFLLIMVPVLFMGKREIRYEQKKDIK